MVPENAWLIPVLPLAAYVLTVFVGPRLGEGAAYIGIGALAVDTALAFWTLAKVAAGATAAASVAWLTIGETQVRMGFQVGRVEAALLAMVTLVSWMIFVFSRGYMHGDARFNRFYAHLCLFVFGMLTLVVADNLILFFVAWEIMGLCSYLLIGHWFEEVENARAAYKAFIVTRLGDVGLMAGIWLLFHAAGSFRFADVLAAAEAGRLETSLATLAALLLFAGAVGKSAQVPLHIWLPDAMAGPTPVSALIHAATMVAAGVFLVARSFPLFEAAPAAMTVVAFIGAATALLAALIGTVQTDIKKVLAYSTVSQLGYMMMGLGVGAFAAGLFHLESHAFFKALLFLAAGSVIHAAHTQEMHQMGGLFGKLRVTGATFLVGMLALAGLPPFAGFFSKDEILLEAYHSRYPILFWAGLVGAFLTAYYMMRAALLTFFGKPRDHHVYDHAHESPPNMTVPLLVLAVPATLFGFLGSPFLGHAYQRFVAPAGEVLEPSGLVTALAVAFALGGLAVAYAVYGAEAVDRAGLIRSLRPLYVLFKEKFYFDHLGLAVARLGVGLAAFVGAFDKYVVDGLVNLVAWLALLVGRAARALTMGSAQGYALVMFAAVALALFLYQFRGG